MMFEEARQAKFNAGRAAHPDSPWDAKHVDAPKEMQDELLDLWNYASLLGDDVLRVRVQLWCEDVWQAVEDLGD